jgi:hypothetical protein
LTIIDTGETLQHFKAQCPIEEKRREEKRREEKRREEKRNVYMDQRQHDR